MGSPPSVWSRRSERSSGSHFGCPRWPFVPYQPQAVWPWTGHGLRSNSERVKGTKALLKSVPLKFLAWMYISMKKKKFNWYRTFTLCGGSVNFNPFSKSLYYAIPTCFGDLCVSSSIKWQNMVWLKCIWSTKPEAYWIFKQANIYKSEFIVSILFLLWLLYSIF